MTTEQSDAEQAALSKNPRFLAILERSLADYRAHGGYTQEEVERMFGIKPKRQAKLRNGRGSNPPRKSN